MLIDRHYSSNFLKLWYTSLTSNHEKIKQQNRLSKDQWALHDILTAHQELKVCALPNVVSFVADGWTRYISGQTNTLFTHWTSAKSQSPHKFKSSH